MDMKVKTIMTACPYKVDAETTLEKGLETMNLYNIRHLPVTQGEDLLGVVTLPSIKLANAICESLQYCPQIGEICSEDPYIVNQDTSLSELANEMAEKKLEYALVQNQDNELVGIVTTTDLCKAMHRILEGQN